MIVRLIHWIFLSVLFFGLPAIASGQTYISTSVKDSVEIIIDTWGVPHIYAQKQEDLFFAQGFNAARDRLFQFEIWRRQATGTVAEILGRRELKRDIGTRLFSFRGDMEEEMRHYHPQGKLIIESFVAGINSYIDWINDRPDQLPLPFKILKIIPKHWTPEVVVSRHQGLLGNIGQELDMGRLVHLLGEQKVREIKWFHPFDPILKIDPSIDASHLLENILELYNAYRKPVSFKPSDLGMSESPGTMPSEDPDFLEDHSNMGSNNWVINGSHTQSDYPILANDPHRSLAIPSLRYMAHLVGPGWNVIGGGEPEIPGISIGHNEYGAWGLTVFLTDAEDLYVYRLNPQNKNEYWHDGQWLQMSVIEEQIPLKGSQHELVQLHYTLHGPVVFQDIEKGIAYAVRCGWREVGGSPYLASLRMNQSIDFESFRDACNYSHIPGENMVWADRAGNIGWQAVGISPIRNGFSGLVPIPGDGSHEWSGYLEIKKKPHAYNPPSGMIITANENLTTRDYPYPEALGYLWPDPIRGDRIAECLSAGRKANLTDMMELQNDQFSIPARTFIALLEGLESGLPLAQTALDALRNWNYMMDANSIAASIFDAWERKLKEAFINAEVPPVARPFYGSVQHKVLADWLVSPDGVFGSQPLKGRDRLLIQTLEAAVSDLAKLLGSDLRKWQYGQTNYKHVQIKHALGEIAGVEQNAKLNTKILARGGSAATVGNTGGNLNQSSGATFKILVDTEDWDRALAINCPGQSGNPDDKHYQDLFEPWGKDKYFPLFYSREKVLEVADQIIYLVPGR